MTYEHIKGARQLRPEVWGLGCAKTGNMGTKIEISELLRNLGITVILEAHFYKIAVGNIDGTFFKYTFSL